MIKIGKKRITVTLDEDTILKAEEWKWLRTSWSYIVNQALRTYFKTLDEGAKNLIEGIIKNDSKEK